MIQTAQKIIRVLLIEDNLADVMLVEEILQEAEQKQHIQFEIHYTDHLKIAEEWIYSKTFDVILLDCSLPDSQGLDGLIYFNSLGLKLPIVLLTGLEQTDLKHTAVALGAKACLVKGYFQLNTLVETLKRLALSK